MYYCKQIDYLQWRCSTEWNHSVWSNMVLWYGVFTYFFLEFVLSFCLLPVSPLFHIHFLFPLPDSLPPCNVLLLYSSHTSVFSQWRDSVRKLMGELHSLRQAGTPESQSLPQFLCEIKQGWTLAWYQERTNDSVLSSHFKVRLCVCMIHWKEVTNFLLKWAFSSFNAISCASLVGLVLPIKVSGI